MTQTGEPEPKRLRSHSGDAQSLRAASEASVRPGSAPQSQQVSHQEGDTIMAPVPEEATLLGQPPGQVSPESPTNQSDAALITNVNYTISAKSFCAFCGSQSK